LSEGFIGVEDKVCFFVFSLFLRRCCRRGSPFCWALCFPAVVAGSSWVFPFFGVEDRVCIFILLCCLCGVPAWVGYSFFALLRLFCAFGAFLFYSLARDYALCHVSRARDWFLVVVFCVVCLDLRFIALHFIAI